MPSHLLVNYLRKKLQGWGSVGRAFVAVQRRLCCEGAGTEEDLFLLAVTYPSLKQEKKFNSHHFLW